jgi:tRNA dimethylallyltransferase
MNPNATVSDEELQKLLSKIPLPLKQKNPNATKKPKVIIISGPTAVGKTKLSIAVAEAVGGEVVSADSMQVYRGMDIGTAKVTGEEKGTVPHYLIDIRNIDESFNVMDFYKEAHAAIKKVLTKGGVPIVVGGTGFYIHALIYGPPAGPPSVPEVRKDIEEQIEKQGTEALFEKLKEQDPDYAKTITGADRQKIVRALEIIALTNKKVSDFPKMQSEEIPYDFRCWFLYASKEVLYPHIEMRCDEMIANGFIEEVRELDKQGLRKNSSASQAIGYRQCLDFLASEGSPDDFEVFVSSFKRASRRYAKRQFTWFKKEPLFRWLSVENVPLEKLVETVCQDYELSF